MSVTRSGNAHLAYVSNRFALSFFDLAVELLPEICDCEDAIGALNDRVQGFLVVKISLSVNQ